MIASERPASRLWSRKTVRLAYIVNNFPSLSETFIWHEIRGLTSLGLAIDVFPLQQAAPGLAALVASESGPSAGFRLRSARDVEALADVIGSGPYDHIHAHYAAKPATVARLVAARTGRTYSVTAHAYDIFRPNPDLLANLQAARFVVTVSEYNRQYLRRLGVTNGVHVISCGVDLSDFSRRRPYPAASRLVLAVGRLVPKKGFGDLIRACGHLRDAGVRYRCAIIGAGPELERLRDLSAALRLDGQVSLEGPKLQRGVRDALEACRLFVLPATIDADGDRDGSPQVIKEAMAMEVPVVTTRTAGLPELVDGSCGIVVPRDNPGALAEAIGRLLDASPSHLQALGRAGRAKVRAGHSLEYQVGRMYRLLTGASSIRGSI